MSKSAVLTQTGVSHKRCFLTNGCFTTNGVSSPRQWLFLSRQWLFPHRAVVIPLRAVVFTKMGVFLTGQWFSPKCVFSHRAVVLLAGHWFSYSGSGSPSRNWFSYPGSGFQPKNSDF